MPAGAMRQSCGRIIAPWRQGGPSTPGRARDNDAAQPRSGSRWAFDMWNRKVAGNRAGAMWRERLAARPGRAIQGIRGDGIAPVPAGDAG